MSDESGSMGKGGSFSERHGYVRPKPIVFQHDLPAKLREPIIKILKEVCFMRLAVGDYRAIA